MNNVAYEFDALLLGSELDSPTLERLSTRLSGDGFHVQLVNRHHLGVDFVSHAVEKAMMSSRILIVAMSINLTADDWEVIDYGVALFCDPNRKDRRLVPLRLDEARIGKSLSRFEWIDWRGESLPAYEHLLTACHTHELIPDSQRSEVTLSLAHSDWIRAAEIAPDGNTLVTAADDKTVRAWDLSTGRSTAVFEGHQGAVCCLKISQDGRQIVSGAEDCNIRIWNLSSGRCDSIITGHDGAITSIDISSDGKSVLSGSTDGTVRLWNIAQESCVATLDDHGGPVWAVAFAEFAGLAISGANDGCIRTWDLTRMTRSTVFRGHSGGVTSLAVACNVAISGSQDGNLRVWDLGTGECNGVLPVKPRSLAISHDGKHVAVGSQDCSVRILKIATLECKSEWREHNGPVTCVAMCPLANRVISVSDDNLIRVWDATFSSSTHTVTASMGKVQSGVILRDGTCAFITSADGYLRKWDLVRGEEVVAFPGHRGAVTDVQVTSDCEYAITSSDDKSLRVWDIDKEYCCATLTGHSKEVLTAAISDDHKFAVSGAADNTVRIWDIREKVCTATLRGHDGWVHCVRMLPQGRVISASADSTLRIWNMNSGEEMRVLSGHSGWVYCVAVTPDGTRAISGSGDSTIRLWDVDSGNCLLALEGHTEPVKRVAIADDGMTALSGSEDGSCRFWNLSDGRCIDIFDVGGDSVVCAAYLPEGRQAFGCILTGGIMRFWRPSADVTEGLERQVTRYTSAKVLLVGESGVGKSGLAMRLATGSWDRTESTDGHWATRVDVHSHHDTQWATRFRLRNGTVEDAGIRREIWLWDFAGQADYRLIHQLFMDQTAVAVLVFNPQSDTLFDGLGRWDHAIQRASRRKFCKLLVAGRMDVGKLQCSRSTLDAFRVEHGFDDYLETSAKTGAGCAELMQTISDRVEWDKLPVTGSNVVFDRLKSEILKSRDRGEVLIRMGDLIQRLRLTLAGLTFSADDVNTVVDLLSNPGLVWKLDFGDFLLLQPEQINSYAAALIRRLREDENELGIVAEDDVYNANLSFEGMVRLPHGEEEIVLRAMGQTLVSYGLCSREKTDQGVQLVFPAFFGTERPENPGIPPVFVSYEFSGHVEDVYATLVVRLQYTAAFEKRQLWRHSADFETQTGAHIGIRLHIKKEGWGRIDIYFSPNAGIDTTVLFVGYVDGHLRGRCDQTERFRHYVCPACGYAFKDVELTREELIEGGEAAFVCCVKPKCRTEIPLWDEIEEKFASESFKDRIRILREQSAVSIDNESRELILLGHAFAIVGEAGQIFRPTPNSDHGIDGEIEFKDDQGRASGRRVYLQLKSGDSYLRMRKRDRSEVFSVKKERWADYWINQGCPVFLVIRTSDGRIRWMNVTQYLRDEKNRGSWPVSQIQFSGEDFSVFNLLRLRRECVFRGQSLDK